MAELGDDSVPLPVRIRSWMGASGRSESVLLGLGGVIGVLTGLLAFALVEVIHLTQRIAWGSQPSTVRTVLVPTLGALVVGLLLQYWASEPSGGGIVEVIRTIALRGGRFRKRVPFAMLLASGIALGTGGSGGREAPIVLGGGAVGSLVGAAFRVDEDRMRTLVAAGAAAGIGASFNAPIGGMLFAIELILGRLSGRSLQVVVLAAVTGSVTARELVGPEIAFAPDTVYSLRDPREMLGYAVLGVLAVLVGLGFLHGERIVHNFVAGVRLWMPAKVALGGLVVGLVALAVPEVLGSGHNLPPIFGDREPITTMLDGMAGDGLAGMRFLLLLCVAKLGATLVSVGTGNAVGSLLPTLFTGAALGGAVGTGIDLLIPGAGVQPGAFALVGMAAVFAAAARAPLTAILIVFELTGDYGLVLPLMLAAGLATFLADRVAPDGIYYAPLRREGIAGVEPEEIDVMQTVTVGEVMTVDLPTLAADMPLEEVRRTFEETGRHGFAVVDHEGELMGVLTLSDLDDFPVIDDGPDDDERPAVLAADLATRRPLTVSPTDPVFRAISRMASADIGRLPVIDHNQRPKLVGMLRRADIVKAYGVAVNQGIGVQQRRERSRLRDLSGVHFEEIRIQPSSPVVGKAIRDLRLPSQTVITSVRRTDEVLVPNGDTVLQLGDVVVALIGPGALAEVRTLLAPDAEPRRRLPTGAHYRWKSTNHPPPADRK